MQLWIVIHSLSCGRGRECRSMRHVAAPPDLAPLYGGGNERLCGLSMLPPSYRRPEARPTRRQRWRWGGESGHPGSMGPDPAQTGPIWLNRARPCSIGPAGGPSGRAGGGGGWNGHQDTGGVRTAALCLPVVVSALSVCCLAPSEFGGLPPLPSDARTLGARTQDWRTLCAIRTGCRADIRHEPA